MYEIWLTLNIVWEIVLSVWPAVVLAAVLWLAIVVTARRRPQADWRRGLGVAIAVGVVLTIVAVFALPPLTRSSIAQMAYWVDWANLIAIAAGVGAVGAAFAWPLAAMRGRRAG